MIIGGGDDSSGSDEDSSQNDSTSDEVEKEVTSEPAEVDYEDENGTCPATTLTSEAPMREIPKIVITKVDEDENDSSSSSSSEDVEISSFLPLPENPNLNSPELVDIRNANSDSNEYFFNLIDSNDIQIKKKEEPIRNEKKMQTTALQNKFTSIIDTLMNSFIFAF